MRIVHTARSVYVRAEGKTEHGFIQTLVKAFPSHGDHQRASASSACICVLNFFLPASTAGNCLRYFDAYAARPDHADETHVRPYFGAYGPSPTTTG
jgi:hypothetical protein